MYADQESDLVQNWNRFYDPSIGRELEPDPVLANSPPGENSLVYGYAGNNPVSVSDPTGNWLQFGTCENWGQAISAVQRIAGCDTIPPDTCPNSCGTITNPATGTTCNLCTILKPDQGPGAFFVNFPPPKVPSLPPVGSNTPTAVPVLGFNGYSDFNVSLCTGDSNLVSLEKAIFAATALQCTESLGVQVSAADAKLKATQCVK